MNVWMCAPNIGQMDFSDCPVDFCPCQQVSGFGVWESDLGRGDEQPRDPSTPEGLPWRQSDDVVLLGHCNII